MKPKLYRHYDSVGKLLYVGVSVNFLSRLANHKTYSHWFDKISKITIENFETKEEMFEAERQAIKKEKPFFNRTILDNLEITRDGFLGIPKLSTYLKIPQGRLRAEIQYGRFPLIPVNKKPYYWLKTKIDKQLENKDFQKYVERLRQ